MSNQDSDNNLKETEEERPRGRQKPDPKPIEWFRENIIPIAGVLLLSLLLALLFLFQGNTDRTRSKDLADIINNLVQAIAIITGGAWAIFTFSKGRQFQESLVLSVSGRIVVIDGQTYIAANTSIKNIGASKIVFNFKSCSLIINEYLKVSKNEVITAPEKTIGNFYALHEEDKYMEPNEIIYGTRLISIPNAPDVGFRLDFIVISAKKAFRAKEGYTWQTSCIIEKPTASANIGTGGCSPEEG